jgi:pullulanase/glycogen debranching enzyme
MAVNKPVGDNARKGAVKKRTALTTRRFLDACRQDPVLSSVKLIAEPWDIGPGGYPPLEHP